MKPDYADTPLNIFNVQLCKKSVGSISKEQ